jgi:hypothetical protein
LLIVLDRHVGPNEKRASSQRQIEALPGGLILGDPNQIMIFLVSIYSCFGSRPIGQPIEPNFADI